MLCEFNKKIYYYIIEIFSIPSKLSTHMYPSINRAYFTVFGLQSYVKFFICVS